MLHRGAKETVILGSNAFQSSLVLMPWSVIDLQVSCLSYLRIKNDDRARWRVIYSLATPRGSTRVPRELLSCYRIKVAYGLAPGFRGCDR